MPVIELLCFFRVFTVVRSLESHRLSNAWPMRTRHPQARVQYIPQRQISFHSIHPDILHDSYGKETISL